MNVNNENEKLIDFWNKAFEQVKPMTLKAEDFDISMDFHKLLKRLGDECHDVLDIGCGWGYGLFAAKLLGSKMTYGLGIDPSEYAINVIEESCYLSDIHGLEGRVGTHEILSVYDDASFDGMICSNTLDVIPEETSHAIIAEIKRLLKPDGLILLKFNFFLTDELIEKIGMKEIDKDAYAVNGILRGVNHTTAEWVSAFDGFEILEETTYPRVPNGPKDRVILLRKTF